MKVTVVAAADHELHFLSVGEDEVRVWRSQYEKWTGVSPTAAGRYLENLLWEHHTIITRWGNFVYDVPNDNSRRSGGFNSARCCCHLCI